MDNSTAAVVAIAVVAVGVHESCCFRCSLHNVVLDVVELAAKQIGSDLVAVARGYLDHRNSEHQIAAGVVDAAAAVAMVGQ